MRFVIKVIVNALVLIALAGLFPKMIFVGSFGIALLTGLIIAILNGTLRPLFQFLALPFTILTFGIFALIVNGFVLEMAVSFVGQQIQINGFFNMVLVAMILSFVQSTVFNYISQNFNRQL